MCCFYQTWAYPAGYDVYLKRFTDPREMQSEIDAGYQALAGKTGGTIVLVGDAFASAQASFPQFGLYTPGDYHASGNGYYLSALCFYAAIYGQAPVVTTPMIADVIPGEAKQFAGIAAENPSVTSVTPSLQGRKSLQP